MKAHCSRLRAPSGCSVSSIAKPRTVATESWTSSRMSAAGGEQAVGELERLAVQQPLDLDQALAQVLVVAGVGPEVQRGLVGGEA